MLSPEFAMVEIARNCADMPDAVATAANPPSSAAIRFSKISWMAKTETCHGTLHGCRVVNVDARRWGFRYVNRRIQPSCEERKKSLASLELVTLWCRYSSKVGVESILAQIDALQTTEIGRVLPIDVVSAWHKRINSEGAHCGIIVDEVGRCIDGDCAGFGGGIGHLARVELQGLEFEWSGRTSKV